MHWSTTLEPTRPTKDLVNAALRVADPVTAFRRWPRGDWLLGLLVPLCERGDAARLLVLCAERVLAVTDELDPDPRVLLDGVRTWAQAELAGDWRLAWDAAQDLSYARSQARSWRQVVHASPHTAAAIQAVMATTQLVLDSRLQGARVAAWVATARVGLDEEARSEELAALAELLRAQELTGRPLKDGELVRARPALQVCHDHVVTTIPAASLTPVSFLHAYVLREALKRALVRTLPPDHPEPWSGTPTDVDVHTLTAITQRIAASEDPVGALGRALQLLGLSVDDLGQWAGIRAISPSP
ncbi:MAG: hypothetical protein KTR31_20050 [Myxococcales bacterium]|nr:hypothetical protein [Myxococcales bacterium]